MPKAPLLFHGKGHTLKDYWNVSHKKAKGTKRPKLNLERTYNLRRKNSLDAYDSQAARQTGPGFPLDVVLVIAEFSTLEGILRLCQTCTQLRYLCARLHLKKLGILNLAPAVTEIRLVGGPFAAQTVSLLRNITPTPASQLDTPRMSVIVDFYHITSFLCDVRLLLKTNTIVSFELVILDDEHSLLDDCNLSASLLNIFSHLSPHCKRISFKAGPANSSRHSLHQLWVPVYTPKPRGPSIRNGLASLTEVKLSLPLFYLCSLKSSTSFLLDHPNATSFSLTCSTASEAEEALSNTHIPMLEYLSLRVDNASLVTLPTTFLRSHSNLRHIYLSALFHWGEATFVPSQTRITLPSLTSATISSKYAGFDVIDSSSLLDLHIYSFMAFPVPENRGYCEAVQSLVNIWINSKTLWLASDFTASFTFPRRLASHLAFLEDLPIYQCSCTPATHAGKVVHHIGRIKIFLDSVTRLAVPYISKWICHFPDVRELTIVAESISVDVNLLSVEMLRDGSPKLQRVNCLASLRS